MAKGNPMRITEGEKSFIEYIRELNPFQVHDLMNQLEVAILKAKIYIAEEEGITRKEAQDRNFEMLETFLEALKPIRDERDKETLKKIT